MANTGSDRLRRRHLQKKFEKEDVDGRAYDRQISCLTPADTRFELTLVMPSLSLPTPLLNFDSLNLFTLRWKQGTVVRHWLTVTGASTRWR